MEKHELYCGGHMIEAAVAHHRATGKVTFLNVAIKFAGFLDQTFGPGNRHWVTGHEELELALVKLYHEKYENLNVLITGGDHDFLHNKLKISIFAAPDLVLLGLNEILDYNDLSG